MDPAKIITPVSITTSVAITITGIPVAEHRYCFDTFNEWVNVANKVLPGYNKRTYVLFCIDAGGFQCRIGADMMRARDNNRFPVNAYLVKNAHLKRLLNL